MSSSRHTRQGTETAVAVFAEKALVAADFADLTRQADAVVETVRTGPAPVEFADAFASTMTSLIAAAAGYEAVR